MSYMKRLHKAFQGADKFPITPQTKYVFFSDCHRGSGTNNDNFLKNKNHYTAALQYYYTNDYHYVEVGDGDELWENKTLKQIMTIYEDVFALLQNFHTKKRLTILFGNHDMSKKKNSYPLMGFPVTECLILFSTNPSFELRVTHGHQADLFNSVFWKLARFLVRKLWTPLEYFGVQDPTSAAKNNRKKNRLEKKYIAYALKNHCFLLTGHTHRPTLCTLSSPYCNCGSCVHPQGITCIELEGYEIRLVKWTESTLQERHCEGFSSQCRSYYPIYIRREVLHSDSFYGFFTSS